MLAGGNIRRLCERKFRLKSPYFLQKSPRPDQRTLTPGNCLFEGAHEHLVEAQSVGAETFNDRIGIYDIAFRLTHLLSPFGQDKPVRSALLVGFTYGHKAYVI